MGGLPRWQCSFTYISWGLCACYFIILIVVLRLHHLLLTRHQERWAQKLFLSLAALHSTLRALYFGMWPSIRNLPTDPCSPSVSDEQSAYPWLDTLGLIPVALFLSTFSVNVVFFARVYHILLGQRLWCYRYLLGGLTLVNAAVYILTFTDVATNPSEMLTMLLVYTLTFSTIFIAAGFVIYSVLIYWIVTKMTHAKGISNAAGVLQGPPSGNTKHIAKMVQCSCVCLLCFLVRAATIPIGDQFADNGVVAGIYSFISEVVPMTVMLVLFEPDHDAKFGAPPKPLSNRHHLLTTRPAPKVPLAIEQPRRIEPDDDEFDVGSLDTEADSPMAPFTPMNLPFTPLQQAFAKESDSPVKRGQRGGVQLFSGSPRDIPRVDRQNSFEVPRSVDPRGSIDPLLPRPSPMSDTDYESYSQLKDQPLFMRTDK